MSDPIKFTKEGYGVVVDGQLAHGNTNTGPIFTESKALAERIADVYLNSETNARVVRVRVEFTVI